MSVKRLTAIFVESVKPIKGRRSEYADELTRGLHLRVGENGHKSWSVVLRVEGRKRRMTLGSYPAVSVSAARSLALKAIAKAQSGDDPLAQQKAATAETIETIGRAWVEQHAKLNNRSWRAQERQLELYVFPKLRKRAVSSLRRRDIIELIDDISQRPHRKESGKPGGRQQGGATAADNVLRVFRSVLNWAVAKDRLAVNPALGVKAPQKPKARERTLTDLEIATVWDGAVSLG